MQDTNMGLWGFSKQSKVTPAEELTWNNYLGNGATLTDGSGCWQTLHILQSLTRFTIQIRSNSNGQEIAFKFKCAFLPEG